MRNPIVYGISITMLSFGLLACGGGGGGGSVGGSTGTLSVGVTDAPVDDVKKVLVQFTGVAVKPSEGDAIDIPLSGDSQTCLDLLDEVDPVPTPVGEPTVRCIELKELQGTMSANLLENVVLNAGKYNWIRLDVDADLGVLDSIVELDDGSVQSLYIPSGSQTGLKLNTGFTILAGGSSNFVIDFDLRKSVNDPQGFPDYRLIPSLRLIDLSESGSIVGTVEPSLLTAEGCTGDVNTGDGFAVYVYEGGAGTIVGEEGSAAAPLTSTGISYNGDTAMWEYIVGFVAPGVYTVAFTCQAADDSPEVSDDGTEFVESSDSPTTVVTDQSSTVDFL
jgi:hypothetical protein